MSPVLKRALAVALVAAVALAAAIYWYTRQTPARMAQRPAPPPPEVGVVVVQPAEVPFPVEYAGRIAGFRDVEVRPLVGGILLKREYEEGARVKQGQVLFRIDPATYDVALARGQAQLQQAQATLRQAEENYKRIQELERRQVATERQLDEAIAARDQARAAIHLAEAEIQAAKLNLGYTIVNAPVSGVTALTSPPVGTLIQAQQTLLTTITQLDPAYVNFSFTDEEGQRFRALNERRAKPITEKDLTVELQYANGTAYPQQGRIDTAARRVDLQTGTIQARAVFPNPDGVLLPGQFVRVRIHGVTLPDAIIVPQQAVSQGPQGPSVFVVGENNVAEARQVRLGAELAQGWVVQEGLKGGERIVVDGVIRVRAGAPVRPAPLAAAAQAAGPRP
jgi:membrane fusion protein (multidrug efflux system)